MSSRVVRAYAVGASLVLVACGGSSPGVSAHTVDEAGVRAGDAGPTVDPNSIAAQGIYADLATGTVAKRALEFTPDYPLWSDGAAKRRWVLLPDGEQIDTSDMDHWQFPVGTKFVKEFSLDGVRLETRVIEHVSHTGNLKKDIAMSAFVWNEAQTDAVLTKDGVVDLFSTPHDVPKQKDCIACHAGENSGTLGFSAIQLSESGMLDELVERGLLSNPPERSFRLPGSEVERAAIGTLHANCGHCHTEGTPADVMRLRVLVGELERPFGEWQLYQTTIGRALEKWTPHPERLTTRIVPGVPDASALLYRMERRDTNGSEGEQMPPLASEVVDMQAVERVRAWIAAMEPLPMTDAGAGDAGMAAQEDAGAIADAARVEEAEAGSPVLAEDAGVPMVSDAGMDAAVGPDFDAAASDDAAPPVDEAGFDAAVDADEDIVDGVVQPEEGGSSRDA